MAFVNLKLKPGSYKGISMAWIVLLVVVAIALSFFATAGITWLIMWCFGYAEMWSWTISLGVWLICIMLQGITVNVKER